MVKLSFNIQNPNYRVIICPLTPVKMRVTLRTSSRNLLDVQPPTSVVTINSPMVLHHK